MTRVAARFVHRSDQVISRLRASRQAGQPTDEFDQLYAQGATRRRVMVIGLHGRISGHASRVRTLDWISTTLRGDDDVWWTRKDQIAQWVLDHPGTAAWVDREPAPVGGLPDPDRTCSRSPQGCSSAPPSATSARAAYRVLTARS